MTPESFSELASLIPDGLLLITGEGRVVAANLPAEEMLLEKRRESTSTLNGFALSDLVAEPSDELDGFLRLCRRSREEIVGAMRRNGDEAAIRLFGRLISPGTNESDTLLLLRLPNEDAPLNRFKALSQKVDELGSEVTRRRRLEQDLRGQVQRTAFGRDVGAALANKQELGIAVRCCCNLIVEHFDVSLAAIWVKRSDDDRLELQGRAGIDRDPGGHGDFGAIADDPIARVAQRQERHITNDAADDQLLLNYDWLRDERIVSFAGYPLVVDGRSIGVMALFTRGELSTDVIDTLEAAGRTIALGIERIRVQQQLIEKAEALEAADRRKDEFLAMLAHELRNPLAPLLSGLEILKLENGSSEVIGLMQNQVEHLVHLVDDLLDVSRIMRGRIELRIEPVSFEEIVDHAVKMVQPEIRARHHTLSVTLWDDPVWLEADRVRLGQVVINLLHNAAKYTPEGGQIDIICGCEDNLATLTVRDNGIGIEPEFLPVVFDLFSQAERGLARSEGGLGIGLTLVRQLIDLHHGRVEVASEGTDQGSEFTISLPRVQMPAVHGERTVEELDLLLESRILIVDDRVDAAKLLGHLLRAMGANNLELAHDGHSAIEVAKRFRPDIVFLDIGLPGLSGFEVAERLRAIEELKPTTIVALTGYGTSEDRRRGREAGFDEHITKPVSLDCLKDVLSGIQTR